MNVLIVKKSSGEVVYTLYHANKKGGQYSLQCIKEDIVLSEFRMHFMKGAAVAVVFFGDKIITRLLQEADNPEKMMKQIIPSGAPGQFVRWVGKDNAGKRLLWISPEAVLLEIIHAIEKEGWLVTVVFPGIACSDLQGRGTVDLHALEKLLSDYKEGISAQVTGDTGEITGKSRHCFLWRKKLRKAVLAGLFILLGLLMIHFFFGRYLSRVKAQQDLQLSVHREMLMRYDSLQSQYDLKQQFLERIGRSKHVDLSYLADRVVLSLHGMIGLVELHLFPEKESEVNRLVFENSIRVEGITNNPVYINEFVRSLKQEPWVVSVSIDQFNQPASDLPGSFIIMIML